MEDFRISIRYSQEAVDLSSLGSPTQASRIGNLSTRLYERYKRKGKLEDLTQAIEYSEGLVKITPEGNPDRNTLLSTLRPRLSAPSEEEGR